MSFDNSNKGALWRNKDKRTDQHPDFTGIINVDGQDYYLSGWSRPPGANPKAPTLTLRIARKHDKQQRQQQAVNYYPNTTFDDDLPF